MHKYAVIYLDLLGFKSFLKDDSEAALAIHQDFHEVLNHSQLIEKIQPASKIPEEHVKSLAERQESNSFNYFLPMSDSVFILSKDPDKVAAQLSTFLYNSFIYGGHAFANPDSSNVIQQDIKELRVSESGEVNRDLVQENWYPVLFRGGISYGDVEVIPSPAICNGQEHTVSNVVGPGVVQAVRLEQSGFSGPRILCDHEFKDQLRGPATKYYRREGDAWELLWPGFQYLEDDNERAQSYELGELFYPALNLWRHFSGKSPERHYRAFLELIVRSHLAFAESTSDPELVNEFLHKKLNEAGLKLYTSVLNSQLVFPDTNRRGESSNEE